MHCHIVTNKALMPRRYLNLGTIIGMKNEQNKPIVLYDTTLRDGTQGEGINFSSNDKVRIANLLDDAGIKFIEGGYPASNERDRSFFEQMKQHPLKNAVLCSFGMTMRADSQSAAVDPMLAPLLEAETPGITIVGKSWDMQVETALQIPLPRNIEIIAESTAYLRSRIDHLVYDAEHFFDGWKENEEYAYQTLHAASAAGADWLVLCDTNGGTMPWEIEEIVHTLRQRLQKDNLTSEIGIHCHNDSGLGIACSLGGVRGGARMVHGTVGGIGERTGNADLIAIAANLELKMGLESIGQEKLTMLSRITQLVFELTNMPVPNNLPFVGRSAFAHKGGMHTSAIARDSRTYEHIDPALVGNSRRILISDLAGKASIRSKLTEFGYQNVSSEKIEAIIAKLKALEHEGYEFEGAEASLDLLFASIVEELPVPFEVLGFRTSDVHLREKTNFSEASIELKVRDQLEHTAAFGNGPVNAIDMAFRKALTKFFPIVENVELLDYKVRVLSGAHGTESSVRVLLSMWDGHTSWQTVGVSTDVIEASYAALADAYHWLLTRSESNRSS